MNAAAKQPKSMALGYLGPEGSNSHYAACVLTSAPELKGRLGGTEGELLRPYPTFYRLIDAVNRGEVPFAILPVENALEGSVVAVMESIGLEKQDLQVHLEYMALVNHALIQRRKGATVRSVLSHPQALAQCRNTLSKFYGEDLHLETAASTSKAVMSLADLDEGWAAIGTPAAAEHYGMAIARKNISDSRDNMTRFILVSSRSANTRLLDEKTCQTLPQKTSLCMALNDRPGVLVDTLLVFKAYGISMTRIESRPSRKKMGDYLFYIDVAGDLTDPQYDRIMMYLKADTTYLKVAGPYASLGLLK